MPASSSQLTLRSASHSRRSRSPQMASSTWPHSLPELEDSVLLDLLVALPSEVVGQLCDLGIQSCADLAMMWESGSRCVQELEEKMRTTFSDGLAAQVRAAWTAAWREAKSRREDHVRSVVQERCSSVLSPGTGSRVPAREVILKPRPVSNRIRTIQPTGGSAGFSVLSGPSGPDPRNWLDRSWRPCLSWPSSMSWTLRSLESRRSSWQTHFSGVVFATLL